MNTSLSRLDRRADRYRRRRRRARTASPARSEWLEVTEAAILYFGITLLPLFVVILLYQWGAIA